MSSKAGRRFPEFHRKLLQLGRLKGPHSGWNNPYGLSEEDNRHCVRVWRGWTSRVCLVTQKDRKKFLEIYAKVFPDSTEKEDNRPNEGDSK